MCNIDLEVDNNVHNFFAHCNISSKKSPLDPSQSDVHEKSNAPSLGKAKGNISFQIDSLGQ